MSEGRNEGSLRTEIGRALNCACAENGSNTSDFILAAMLVWAAPNTWAFTTRLSIPRATCAMALLGLAILVMASGLSHVGAALAASATADAAAQESERA